MFFHLIHIHQDIDTEKPTIAIHPGLNSGAHILYYYVHNANAHRFTYMHKNNKQQSTHINCLSNTCKNNINQSLQRL